MAKKLVLIRHSTTEIDPDKYNPLWRLSKEGIDKAHSLAQNPLLSDLEVVYSSNQLKAIHTGVIIASHLGIWLKQKENLTELTSLTNKWIDTYDEFINDIYTGKIDHKNGGETLDEALKRFAGSVNEIIESEKEKETIAIVAHGNVLSLYTSQFEDRSALEIHHSIKTPDVAVLNWDSRLLEKKFGDF